MTSVVFVNVEVSVAAGENKGWRRAPENHAVPQMWRLPLNLPPACRWSDEPDFVTAVNLAALQTVE